MSALGSIAAPASAAPLQNIKPPASDPDHDGDNDAGVSAASEANEGGAHGPAVKISLSAAAQSLLGGG